MSPVFSGCGIISDLAGFTPAIVDNMTTALIETYATVLVGLEF